jgi:hypothetical protein
VKRAEEKEVKRKLRNKIKNKRRERREKYDREISEIKQERHSHIHPLTPSKFRKRFFFGKEK